MLHGIVYYISKIVTWGETPILRDSAHIYAHSLDSSLKTYVHRLTYTYC
jgi:hypothetical protein